MFKVSFRQKKVVSSQWFPHLTGKAVDRRRLLVIGYWLLVIGSSSLFTGCETFSDTGLGKFYHNTTARFNGYFNAKEKMKDVEAQIFAAHPDNFNKVLDVFAVGDDKLAKSFQGDDETVIKKCTHVIFKHRNSKWVDDCYLLIGKANYFKRDYYSAIESFEYLELKY